MYCSVHAQLITVMDGHDCARMQQGYKNHGNAGANQYIIGRTAICITSEAPPGMVVVTKMSVALICLAATTSVAVMLRRFAVYSSSGVAPSWSPKLYLCVIQRECE